MNAPKLDVLAVLRATSDALQGVADGCTNSEFGIVMGKRAAEIRDAAAAVAELIGVATVMNQLAKGPVGGVSQAQKRAIVECMDAALARIGGAA